MPDDFETRMGVKHAAQHEANALRRGLDGKAPAGAQDPRMFFDVIVVVSLDHRRMRYSRVHVERYVKHLSPLKDRPKPLVVEENPVGQPVHHRSFKAEPADRTFELVGCCLGVGSGQCRKGRKSVGVGAYRLVEAVIGAARQWHGGFSIELLEPRHVCDNTCGSMPVSSISFKRSSPRSSRRCTVAGAAIAPDRWRAASLRNRSNAPPRR